MSAASKTIVLITGANGGIGYELASQLISDASKHVLLGSRSADKGTAAVKELQARNAPGTVELLQLDVSSEASIAAAAEKVSSAHGRVDALVNNAAITGIQTPGGIPEKFAASIATNVTGVVLMLEHFAPLLRKAQGQARVINVTSGLGSITKRFDPTYAAYNMVNSSMQYRVTKAALNMVTANQAVQFGNNDGMKVFAYCPGFTVSNLSGGNKAENGAHPTSQGAAPMVDILAGKRDGEHGGFLHASGQHPW